jgi:hypothetical protein
MTPHLQLQAGIGLAEADEIYLDRLSRQAKNEEGLEWLADALTSPSTDKARAYYFNGYGSYYQNPESLIDKANSERGYAVCVIENIGPYWIKRLGSTWDLDPDFFLNHARNPPEENIWNNLFHGPRDLNIGYDEHLSCSVMDGVFEYDDWETAEGAKLWSAPNFMRRHCWEGPKPYPLSSNTRISYCRTSMGFCK